ncbi:hypothetical protein [Microbacterium resistens]|uniref:hypothetical protein n=1 Tax=Microbacterium resistens TaxID=156977 RepID=UPI0009FF74E2|nr:hypothetical protein [Microbacterium resistens]
MAVPVVEFTVAVDGTMTVTIDGTPHAPAPFAPPWRRESFPAILDALTTRLQTPLRVQVREADGSTFTDIITPPRTRRTDPPPASITSPPPDASPLAITQPTAATMPVVHQVVGEGFVPGEDVAVAIVHTHSDAGNDGTARALLTLEQLATSPTGEIILLGRISGTFVIGRPQ